MKVPFHLRRRSGAEPARACVVCSRSLEELFEVIERFGEFPAIYPLADGFLVKFDTPTHDVIAGMQRLRCLSEHLYLPVDADLSPTLLPDEARGLVRERGLVFLADGRVLSFAPAAPMTAAQLVDAGEVRRRPWRSLPETSARVERIGSIILDLPSETPDSILDSGGGEIGSEDPRPAGSNLPAKVLGQAALGLGQVLFRLGNLLGMRRLADLGTKWVERGLSLAPRLSEALLGRQEAALRELLRWFRAGKLEEALRRALPLGAAGDRGGVPATDSTLPTHNVLYSLLNLLGGKERNSHWFGGGNVHAELVEEYRKAAEQAAGRGDYRRAAFIFGKLLRDYRSAANALMQGGLFHDAAILFLTKLDDRRSAARAFDAAGDFDRAVQLFRQLDDHVAAGDLLHRMGEEQEAVQEYLVAVERLAACHDYQAAAAIMLTKAQLPERAIDFLRTGWQRRPAANAVACAMKLAALHTERGEIQPLMALVAEVREYFASAAHDGDAVGFFNSVAKLADRQGLSEVRDDLRDHALLGLASMLRQRVAVSSKPTDIASTYFGRSGAWSVPLVGDAQFAFKAALQQSEEGVRPAPVTLVRLGTGRVTAACQAPVSGDLFVGFLSGDVVCFRPTSSELVCVKSGDGLHVTSLATDLKGRLVLVLQVEQVEAEGSDAAMRLTSYERQTDGAFTYLSRHDFRGSPLSWLLPLGFASYFGFGLCDSSRTHFLSPQLSPNGQSLAGPHFLAMRCSFPGKRVAVLMISTKTAWCDFNLFKGDQPNEVHLGERGQDNRCESCRF